MEYDYGEYRKDSQALFREEEKRGETLERFEASEKRRREGREPERVLALKNSYGQFEAGSERDKDGKTAGKGAEKSGKISACIGTPERTEKGTA